jgi:hypothetical protein
MSSNNVQKVVAGDIMSAKRNKSGALCNLIILKLFAKTIYTLVGEEEQCYNRQKGKCTSKIQIKEKHYGQTNLCTRDKQIIDG